MLLESSLFIWEVSVTPSSSSSDPCERRSTGTVCASLHSVEQEGSDSHSATPPFPREQGLGLPQQEGLWPAQHSWQPLLHSTVELGENGSTWDIEVGHCSDSTSGSEAVLVLRLLSPWGQWPWLRHC